MKVDITIVLMARSGFYDSLLLALDSDRIQEKVFTSILKPAINQLVNVVGDEESSAQLIIKLHRFNAVR